MGETVSQVTGVFVKDEIVIWLSVRWETERFAPIWTGSGELN